MMQFWNLVIFAHFPYYIWEMCIFHHLDMLKLPDLRFLLLPDNMIMIIISADIFYLCHDLQQR